MKVVIFLSFPLLIIIVADTKCMKREMHSANAERLQFNLPEHSHISPKTYSSTTAQVCVKMTDEKVSTDKERV